MRAILDGAAEPVQQQVQIEIPILRGIFKLLKLIKKEEQDAIFAFQRFFQTIQPLIEEAEDLCLIPAQGFPQMHMFQLFDSYSS